MKMKQSAEFTIYGNTLDYAEMESVWQAVQNAGSGAEITITQSKSSDYGQSSTITYIEIEVSRD